MSIKQAIQLALPHRGGDSNRVPLRMVPEGAYAVSTLTLSGQPTDGDTVTIGDVTYTFQATPAAPYDVDIGADEDATIQNLGKAILALPITSGEYFAGTEAHPDVIPNIDTTGDTVVLTAKDAGTSSIATTASGANLAMSDATLQGGSDLGSTPANSDDWLSLCYTSENLAAQLQYQRSNKICGAIGGAARMLRGRKIAAATPGGQVSGEFIYSDALQRLMASVLAGQWVTDPRDPTKELLVVDTSQSTFTIEKEHSIYTDAFELWTGMICGQLSLALPFGGLGSFSSTFMGRNYSAPTGSAVGTGSVTGEASGPEVIMPARDFANLTFDGSPLAGLVVQQLNVDMNSNVRPITGLGSIYPRLHRLGDFAFTGTMQMHMSNDAWNRYKAGLANTRVALSFEFADPGSYTYGFELPEVSPGAEPASSPGRNRDVIINQSFEAETSRVMITRWGP